MKLIGDPWDFLTSVIALIAALEFGVEFGLFLLLVAIFMRLGDVEREVVKAAELFRATVDKLERLSK